jgi:hypothetical protein
MGLNYINITGAIERMMYKRYERLQDKGKVKLHLEHLKKDTWKHSPDICNFIDGCIVKLENI